MQLREIKELKRRLARLEREARELREQIGKMHAELLGDKYPFAKDVDRCAKCGEEIPAALGDYRFYVDAIDLLTVALCLECYEEKYRENPPERGM